MAYLLKPLKIGKLELSNRLAMPPMATRSAGPSGEVSRELLDYYDEKSKGGYIGLIIIEHSFIASEGKASEQQLSISEDSVIEPLKQLSGIIHNNGSKAVMQINHAGASAKREVTGMDAVAPSVVPGLMQKLNKEGMHIPRELSKEEIKGIVKAFGNAARRVKEAGFDGVEIHSAHGYLLDQFFSPLSNRRSDEYGGSVQNRIRIHLEVIEEVKNAVGDDFTIILRLGAADYLPGGADIEDSIIAAEEFEKAGVDILDISGGLIGYNIPGLTGEGYFSTLTEAIKKVVCMPVVLTGGITQAQAAERLLAEGKADIIGVGRAILNDSLWAKNAIEGFR